MAGGVVIIITSPPDDGGGRSADPSNKAVNVRYSPPPGISPVAMQAEIDRIQRLADRITGGGPGE